MSDWGVQIGDDPLNMIAAMNCPMVMAAVQAALLATGTPWEQSLDMSEQAWLAVEKGYGEWNAQMNNGMPIKVSCMPVFRSARSGEVKA